jgi:hypothetical protein
MLPVVVVRVAQLTERNSPNQLRGDNLAGGLLCNTQNLAESFAVASNVVAIALKLGQSPMHHQISRHLGGQELLTFYIFLLIGAILILLPLILD